MKREPLEALLGVTDGVVVDLKASNQEDYRALTGGDMQDVGSFLESIFKSGKLLEVVTLIVPGWNDNPEELSLTSRFLKETFSAEIPFHVSRFFPHYKLSNLQPTPSGTMFKAIDIAKGEGLHYVYANNIPIPGQATLCPRCGNRLIHYKGAALQKMAIENGRCMACGYQIPGIWSL